MEMETHKTGLIKRTSKSRWGPDLTKEQIDANVEAAKLSLLNGIGTAKEMDEEEPKAKISKVDMEQAFNEVTKEEPTITELSETKEKDSSLSSQEDLTPSKDEEEEFNGFTDGDVEVSTTIRENLVVKLKIGVNEVDMMTVDPQSEVDSDGEEDEIACDKIEKEKNLENETHDGAELIKHVKKQSKDISNENLADRISNKGRVSFSSDREEKNDDEKLPETPADSECGMSDNLNEIDQETNTPEPDQEATSIHDTMSDSSVLNGTPVSRASKRKSKTRSTGKIKKSIIDISNPAYLKPFDFGWKRELVFRSVNDSQKKRQADVYYYTPKGKKVRSFREVVENLMGQDLSIDNFTFFKEPIGLDDPEKEIIRDAKLKLKDPSTATPSPLPKKVITPKQPNTQKTVVQNQSFTPEIDSTPEVPTPTTSASQTPNTQKLNTPKIVFRGSKINFGGSQKSSTSQSKTSVSGQGQKVSICKGIKRSRKMSEDELEIGMLPPMWQPKEKSSSSREKDSVIKLSSGGKPMEVCNIRCPLAMGVIPTLQCHICLCLYHPECIGLEEAMTRTIHSYKCKSCQLLPAKPSPKPITSTSSSIISPPPLTPISSFSTASSANSYTNTSVSNPPPVLTRLTDGKLVNVPRTSTKTPVTKAHSIVGGLTTWLPPSSTIQLSPSTPKLSSSYKNISPAHTSTVDSSSSLPTQTLITMNKKRFIVVPKHNVLSVSPAVTAPSITVADPSSSQITTSELSPSLTNLSTQAYGPGGPILPKPSPTSGGATFVVSSPATPSTTFQNPPGVLLVPYLPQNTQPTGNGGSPTQLPPQYVIVNGPSGLQAGNFIFGNLPQQQLKLPTVPTSQAAEPPSESAGTKRVPESQEVLPLPPSKKLQTSEKYSNRLIENHLQDTSILYNALLTAFQYLTVKELLRAAVVSRLFRDLALHSSLWQTVRLKNCRVRDWAGAAQTLSRAATRHLDLKKSIIPDKSDSTQKADIWGDFINCISKVKTLVKLDLCKCSSQIVQQVAVACPQLESLIAIAIRSSELNLSSLGGCRNMTELKLKSVNPGFELTNITALKDLTNLKHLALTSIKNLNSDIVVVLNNMESMETLELGECMKLPESFISESLSKMTKLRRLRLEKGQGSDCPTLNLLEKIGQCPSITQLELINFDVKNGFEVALANCSNIKTFLIIPTYITQSATTNHLIVEGVSKLSKTLTYFVWGLTLELLRVTDLFIDQWEVSKGKGQQLPQNSKKNSNDCIPIIKPDKQDIPKNKSAPLQVDVLQLSKLHKVLMTLLPKTQVKILKVPFSATWRQTIPGTNQ